MNTYDQKANESIQEILKNIKPEDLKLLIRTVETRPKGWGPTSNAPYYNAEYGKQAAIIIDLLTTDISRDRMFDGNKVGVQAETLRLQFQQGWAWLCDHCEDEAKRTVYKELKESKSICTQKIGKSLRIYVKKKTTQELLVCMKEVPSYNAQEPIQWRPQLMAWIETAEKPDGDIFEINSREISAEDIEFVSGLISQDPCYSVLETGENSIKIAYIKPLE